MAHPDAVRVTVAGVQQTIADPWAVAFLTWYVGVYPTLPWSVRQLLEWCKRNHARDVFREKNVQLTVDAKEGTPLTVRWGSTDKMTGP